MKYLFVKPIALALLCATLFTSCIMEATEVDIDTLNQEILDDWVAKNVADYDSYIRSEDGYFAKVEGGSGTPVYQYDDCWVKYTLTGYNLSGEPCVTRNEEIAYQQGVFDPMVRYVPLFQDLYYDSDDWEDLDTFDYLPEFLNLAFKNEDLNIMKGSKITFYVPYELIDGADIGTDGFACQYTLNQYQPLHAVVEVTDVIADPISSEITELEKFLALNGGVLVNYRESDGEDIEDEEYEEYNEAQEQISEAWSNALDTVANVYLHRHYTPSIRYTYINEYSTESNYYKSNIPDCIYKDYTMEEIDAEIERIITEDYEDMIFTSKFTGDYIEFSGTANIWYIGRFLDGFIFDTNIGGLKEFITGETVYDDGTMEYRASTAYSNYIYAWFYAMPQLRYGQWATIVTTSTNGYNEVTLNDDIPAHTTLLFHVYVEPSDYYY